MTEKGYNLAKLPDGNLEVKFDTGEVFSGDPLEVTAKLAESRLTARGERDQWRQKAETVSTAPPPASQQPIDPNEKATQEWLLNQTAKALGYNSGEEYKAELTRVKSSTEEVSKQTALQQFFTQHPEYPATPEANDLIGKIFDEKGWTEMTADNLHFAHLEALDRHRRDPKQGYEPLSAEAVNSAWANNMQQSSRVNPPPMLRSANPEFTSGNPDPYAMPLADLRKMAINQELNRK